MKKYERIANLIMEDIKAHLYHKKLPTEEFLAKNYGISRITLRKSLQFLKEHGYITSRQGSGYFIKSTYKKEIKNMLNKNLTISQIIKNANLSVGDIDNKLYKVTTTQYEEYFEGIQNFFILDRIRTAEGEPVVFSRCILPVKYVGENFSMEYRSGSLNDYLTKVCSINIIESIALVEAFQETVDEIPEILVKYPLIKLTQQNNIASGLTVLLTYDYIRTDIINLYIRRTIDYEAQ